MGDPSRLRASALAAVAVSGYVLGLVLVIDQRRDPALDPVGARALLLEDPPAAIALREGHAGLLCHRHDEDLWRLRSFIARGRLARHGEGWAFVPETFTPGMGLDPLSMVRMVRDGQRTATAYLARRGWERPQIDWAALERIKRDVFT